MSKKVTQGKYPSTCFVYLICHDIDGKLQGPCKIGISDNPQKRLGQVQNGNPRMLALAFTFHCWDRDWASRVEAAFHSVHRSHRMSGEWFNLDAVDALGGLVEVFSAGLRHIAKDDRDLLNSLAEICNLTEAAQMVMEIDKEEGRARN
jgi:hypothetical protein